MIQNGAMEMVVVVMVTVADRHRLPSPPPIYAHQTGLSQAMPVDGVIHLESTLTYLCLPLRKLHFGGLVSFQSSTAGN